MMRALFVIILLRITFLLTGTVLSFSFHLLSAFIPGHMYEEWNLLAAYNRKLVPDKVLEFYNTQIGMLIDSFQWIDLYPFTKSALIS